MSTEPLTYPRTAVTRGETAQSVMADADELEALAQRLSALSDGNRLKILRLLHACGEMCVCELQDVLGLTAPNLSFHLQVLRYAGFVKSRKEGKRVFYRALSDQLGATGACVTSLFAEALPKPPAPTSTCGCRSGDRAGR